MATLTLFLCMSLFGGSLAAAQDSGAVAHELQKPQSFTLVGTRGGHTFRLDVAWKRVDPRKHTTKVVEGNVIIDGRYAWGTDGFPPTELVNEISAFELHLNAKRINVSRSLWTDLLNLSDSQRYGKRYHWGWHLSENGNLTLGALGSDGAGTYSVRWWVDRGGQVRRDVRHGIWTLPPKKWRELYI